MFSVVRSVTFTEKSVFIGWFVCVCVFVASGGFFVVPPPPPPDVAAAPHTFCLRREQCRRSGLTPACPTSAPVTSSSSLTHTQSDPLAPVLLMDRAAASASSSHDGALLRRSGPRPPRQVQRLHVKVKPRRLRRGRKRKIFYLSLLFF